MGTFESKGLEKEPRGVNLREAAEFDGILSRLDNDFTKKILCSYDHTLFEQKGIKRYNFEIFKQEFDKIKNTYTKESQKTASRLLNLISTLDFFIPRKNKILCRMFDVDDLSKIEFTVNGENIEYTKIISNRDNEFTRFKNELNDFFNRFSLINDASTEPASSFIQSYDKETFQKDGTKSYGDSTLKTFLDKMNEQAKIGNLQVGLLIGKIQSILNNMNSRAELQILIKKIFKVEDLSKLRFSYKLLGMDIITYSYQEIEDYIFKNKEKVLRILDNLGEKLSR